MRRKTKNKKDIVTANDIAETVDFDAAINTTKMIAVEPPGCFVKAGATDAAELRPGLPCYFDGIGKGVIRQVFPRPVSDPIVHVIMGDDPDDFDFVPFDDLYVPKRGHLLDGVKVRSVSNKSPAIAVNSAVAKEPKRVRVECNGGAYEIGVGSHVMCWADHNAELTKVLSIGDAGVKLEIVEGSNKSNVIFAGYAEIWVDFTETGYEESDNFKVTILDDESANSTT